MARYTTSKAVSVVYDSQNNEAVEILSQRGGVAPTNVRKKVLIYNVGGGTVYLGDNKVSVAGGFPLAPVNDPINSRVELDTTGEIWAIAGTQTCELRIMEVA